MKQGMEKGQGEVVNDRGGIPAEASSSVSPTLLSVLICLSLNNDCQRLLKSPPTEERGRGEVEKRTEGEGGGGNSRAEDKGAAVTPRNTNIHHNAIKVSSLVFRAAGAGWQS